VVDSRTTGEGVRRRRHCKDCRRRFTTYEKIGAPDIKVTKRSGKSEPFDFNKLVVVLARVCRDRPGLSEVDFVRIARTIEAELVDARVKNIPSSELVARVLARLVDRDRTAYNRLAADYIDEDGQLRTAPKSADSDDDGQLGLFEESDS
jgi:transcriptional repressor NrdR